MQSLIARIFKQVKMTKDFCNLKLNVFQLLYGGPESSNALQIKWISQFFLKVELYEIQMAIKYNICGTVYALLTEK